MYLKEFERLINIMSRLRKECPWDREQTPETLRQYVLEEAYEVVETIDEGNWDELRKELGDLLLQIVFQAEIAAENQRFELVDSIRHINEKLIERHPHVFGNTNVKDAGEVKENWEQIKLKSENRKSVLQGVPKMLPALLRAQRLQDKAANVGFDWEDAAGVLNKIREEINEVETSQSAAELEDEIGDLIFSLVNLCRFRRINAEDALRKSTEKFIKRFSYIEQQLTRAGKRVDQADTQELDRLWEAAKITDINPDH